VCKNKNVDDTVDCFTSIILQAMDFAIPRNTGSKHKLPHWVSPVLKRNIRTKIYFCRRYRKHKSEQYYSKFSYDQRIVKITIKSDRHNWYKVIDDDLKSQPAKCWKYVPSFSKHNSCTVQPVSMVLISLTPMK
jgi:hypothetical protein